MLLYKITMKYYQKKKNTISDISKKMTTLGEW